MRYVDRVAQRPFELDSVGCALTRQERGDYSTSCLAGPRGIRQGSTGRLGELMTVTAMRQTVCIGLRSACRGSPAVLPPLSFSGSAPGGTRQADSYGFFGQSVQGNQS